MGWSDRVSGLRDADLPIEARRRIQGGIGLVVAGLALLLLATWVWPPGFRFGRVGRDVVLAVGGAALAVAACAAAWTGLRRSLQGFAMGRAPVSIEVSGHRRLQIRRPPGGAGSDGARHYLRLDAPGRRPLGVRVEPDVAMRFRSATAAELWRLGPAVSLRVGDEVLHPAHPVLPFPRETESL